MQFFKGFDIGSAKVTDEEKDEIQHHLIDHLDPEEDYSAAEFKTDLNKTVTNLNSSQKLPVVVGGTGFYIHSALFNFQFSDIKRDSEYVEQALKEIEIKGIDPFYNRLRQVDPKQAEKYIHII